MQILTQMLILLPFNSRFSGESGSASSSLGPHSPPVLEKTPGDWWNAGGGGVYRLDVLSVTKYQCLNTEGKTKH